ncbi:protein At-4/1 [Asparagus officinalis]|uniref:protein At-4/1 n=1 Tax=Asparagus officinalis TaxID=4686 RepID=UPI00098E4DDA|nr:protein At-4/1 [Asparagus officinalis]XP_020264608.1 protein At-4/1 [Asparagus officinalis]XP_020264609.1 protein At-4/1 [Asparagus officinalis]
MARREAFEASCNALRTDNGRLRKLYAESLTKLTSQIKHHKKCQSLKEELGKTSERLLTLKDEYRKTIEMLDQENERKINDLEKQISCYCLQRASDENVIKKLQQELSAHETQIYNLTRNLEEVTANVDFKYNREMQELKDWIIVEQEEKKQLYKKLQDAENELQTMRNKQAEQQRESISIRQVETLKQKIMRLRKENESLKRQKQGSDS